MKTHFISLILALSVSQLAFGNSNVKSIFNVFECDILQVDVLENIEKPKYTRIYDFGDYHPNWAMVESRGLLGFIDVDGNEVVPTIYDDIYSFDDYQKGWALVKKGDHYGFIDVVGNEVVPTIYDDIYAFDDYQKGWAMVRKGDKFGFIDENGAEVIE